MNRFHPLIDYAKTEHIRLLIETHEDGFTIIYCDKTEKRNILKQIRNNKIKIRAKIICHDYNTEFLEEPKLVELNYISSRILRRFTRKREIHTYKNFSPQLLFNFVLVDFNESDRLDLITDLNGLYFSDDGKLKRFMKNRKTTATINRDRNTFIIYYKGE